MNSKQEILLKFGSSVRKFRKNQKLSQEQLAVKANLHRTYIGMIERGEKNITLVNIEKILVALEITFVDLFKDVIDGE